MRGVAADFGSAGLVVEVVPEDFTLKQEALLNVVKHADVALYTLAAVSIWKIAGYAMIVFLAGLQTIPRELYEAASMDGAGRWRQLCSISAQTLRVRLRFCVSRRRKTRLSATSRACSG